MYLKKYEIIVLFYVLLCGVTFSKASDSKPVTQPIQCSKLLVSVTNITRCVSGICGIDNGITILIFKEQQTGELFLVPQSASQYSYKLEVQPDGFQIEIHLPT